MMKTFVPFKKTLLAVILVVASSSLFAHDQPVDHLVFTNPSKISGTDLKLNAVYLFKDVIPGIDAQLSIDSLVGGATVESVDDNSGGVGYTDALQPRVTIPGKALGLLHEAYAVFGIKYYNHSTGNPVNLQSVAATALDIDGNATLKEFAEINMEGGNASFKSNTLDIAVNSLLSLLGHLKYRADNVLGIERDGIDTSALGNMFSVSNNNVNSFTVKYGATSLLTGSTTRQFSLYMKGFSYPNQVTLPIKLVDFAAKYNQSDISLSWKSSQEIDFNYYELQHSSDGETFSTTSLVFGAGVNGNGADYSYVDHAVKAKAGFIYYRLKMVDIDGHFTYSPVRIVRLGEPVNTMSLSIYPNPVSNDLRFTLPDSWQGKQVKFDLYNSSGQRVNTLNVANSSQTESMAVTNLERGVYFVKATCGTETAANQIIKK